MPALLPFGDLFYDMAAKVESDPPPSADEFRQMLRLLLSHRFKLKFHHEAREPPVYALVVEKNESKLSQNPGADSTPHYTPTDPDDISPQHIVLSARISVHLRLALLPKSDHRPPRHESKQLTSSPA